MRGAPEAPPLVQQRVNGDVMVIAHYFAAYNYDVAVDKFDFAPVQSPAIGTM